MDIYGSVCVCVCARFVETWMLLQGSVRTCRGSAPAFSTGPATKTVSTGVRGSALALPGEDFRFQLNA